MFKTKTFMTILAAASMATACSKDKDKKAEPEPSAKVATTETEVPVNEEPAAEVATTEAVIAHHLESFGKLDVEALLSDYTDDSVFVSPMGVLRGKEQIKGLFTAMTTEFAKPGMKFQMGMQHIEGELAFISWSGETADNVYTYGTDTFLVRDGKIVAQTFAAEMSSKQEAEAEAEKSPDAEAEAPAAPTGPTAEALGRHLAAFGKGDVDALMADYGDESVIIGPMGILKGPEQIRPLFEGLVAEFAKPGMKFNMGLTTVEGDMAQITWTAESADNTYSFATDTFFVKDNKIVAQTVGFNAQPKAAK